MVRAVAERLRMDGLKVWFDEWEIKPGDSIPAKIEQGLEYSRVLLLCMSANAFGSDWAQLEAGTFRFRDPLNKERRFIPLRLDDAIIKGSLAQFLYINWQAAEREAGYPKLLNAVRFFEVKLSSISTSVRRLCSRFRYHVEIEATNLSKTILWTSGVTINVPCINSVEKLQLITCEFGTLNKSNLLRVDPDGEVWGFRPDQSFGSISSRCLFLEGSLDSWQPGGKITLYATIEAPWPRMDFHVRAWGNIPNVPEELARFGDPDWTSDFQKDQQGVYIYVVSVGYDDILSYDSKGKAVK